MINESLSQPFNLGSCLGPLLFTLYTRKLFQLIKHHLPMIHCDADDSQVYISFNPNDRAEKLDVVRNMEDWIRDMEDWIRDVEDWIRDIRFWMLNNNLKLRTEFILISTSQQLEQLDNISIRLGDSDIHSMPIARNIGCWFDSDCPCQHISRKSAPLLFTISIIFVGSESVFHSSQLRLLSMHS